MCFPLDMCTGPCVDAALCISTLSVCEVTCDGQNLMVAAALQLLYRSMF